MIEATPSSTPATPRKRRRGSEVVFTQQPYIYGRRSVPKWAHGYVREPGDVWHAQFVVPHVLDVAAVSDRDLPEFIPGVIAKIIEDRHDGSTLAYVQGGGKGGRRYQNFIGPDAASQAQDWIMRWARRRFRVDEERRALRQSR